MDNPLEFELLVHDLETNSEYLQIPDIENKHLFLRGFRAFLPVCLDNVLRTHHFNILHPK